MKMNKRQFLKSAAALSSLTLLPGCDWETSDQKRLRTAHIGVGNMGRRGSEGYLIA